MTFQSVYTWFIVSSRASLRWIQFMPVQPNHPPSNPNCHLSGFHFRETQHELPEEVRQLLNCKLGKNAFVISRR
jgi:hypothetical protein